ncbi:MAG TPA: response regulator [Rectinemataceae bacterium]|nr:response regulator [Rectinemataceae bacterium]
MRRAILYVDDEAVILLALRQELLRHFRGSFLVETALDADEAERVIGELEAAGIEVSLVISDWLMPGRKGDEFLIDLRRSHPRIKSMLVTGQADEEALRRTEREAGLCACFRKPWEMKALKEAIEACLGVEVEG